MSNQDIRKQIENILENSHVGTLATIKQDRPHSRYMTYTHDGLKLFTATSSDTDKVDEIEKNPYTHILLGYEGDGFGDAYVEYQGKVKINESEDLKEELWNSYMENWFDGPNDPKYIVLEIEPLAIRLMNKNGQEPKELDLE
ncbi:general stress protein [Gracilibacillus oryzae]|uniref:General stress protein n=1 Tax=Gracilibacillus oryzae TaxID=1672701 RepID=A0A7C8KXE2_9BACI|nr:pyridoxamine 5'-phosphate oxidase family protein [Gracilibacillus oryzae]KAB8127487.1 general stress protein [Gracilibacillus oryzae]